MLHTRALFDARKHEIEVYASRLNDIAKNSETMRDLDSDCFLKIMKSNYVLMLYNIVEATLITGLEEIYSNIKDDKCTFDDVIKEIQKIWISGQIKPVYGMTTTRKAYENMLKRCVASVSRKDVIILDKANVNISGNVDARKIRELLGEHKIEGTLNNGRELLSVKDGRNKLAHGNISFSDYSRNFTLNDLDATKEHVLEYLDQMLLLMEDYCKNKMYMKKH